MSRIRSAGTGFEKKVFREIRRFGIRFRTNYAGTIGKPDIALPKARKAVLLHSDFWHGWQLPRWEAKLPTDFWKQKIRKNRLRDRKVVATLRRHGWKVLAVWEHQIARDAKSTIRKIVSFLK